MPFELVLSGELFASFETLPGIAVGMSEGLRHRAAARAPALTSLHTGADAVAAAADAWQTLADAGGVGTAFQTLAVARAAARAHVAAGAEPRIAVVSEHGRPRVVLSAALRRVAGLRVLTFLGDPLIQYGDAVAAPDATHQHFAAAFDAVAAGADLALLRKVRADARARGFLEQRAHIIAEEESPYVDLRAKRSVHSRKCRRLRRLRRRLEEYGPLSLEITRGGAARAPLVEAIALKRAWLAERGLDSAVIGTRAWENALLQLTDESPDSPLAVARLTAGGEIAAAEIALAHDGRWHAFLGAIAPKFAHSGPGRLQIELTIERCRDDGFAIYDLLPPAESYKRAITNGAVAVRDYAIGYGALGGLALLAARAAWRIKPQLARLPAPLRRAGLSAIGLRRAGR